MRAAFFHDTKFARDRDGRHHSNHLSDAVLARYLRHFEHLTVVGRVIDVARSEELVVGSERVTMACVETSSAAALLAPSTFRHVARVLTASDCAILRLPSTMGLVACRVAERLRTPWMAEIVGDPAASLWTHGSLAGKVLAPIFHVLMRRDVACATHALYVTRDHLQRRYPTRGVSVGCADVQIDPPRRDVLVRRFAKIDGAAGGPRTLGLIGFLDVDYKGHETALQALATRRKLGEPVRLRLLGAGDPTRWRRRAATLGVLDLVEFSGALPSGAPVLAWLDDVDVLVMPSRTEGLPRALVEGMSRAVPAIGARVGAIPELLPDRWLHAPSDPRALARLVGEMTASRETMRREAQRNWEVAHEYAGPVLETKRDAFLRAFRSFAAGAAHAPARVTGSGLRHRT